MPRRMDTRFDEFAIKLYRKRIPVPEIVAQIKREHGVKVCNSTIYAALHRAGISVKRRNYSSLLRNEVETAWIVEQWNAGLIAADIQRAFERKFGHPLFVHSLGCVLREFDLIAGKSVRREAAKDPVPAWKLRAYNRLCESGVPDDAARRMAHIAHIDPALVAARMAVMSPVL